MDGAYYIGCEGDIVTADS